MTRAGLYLRISQDQTGQALGVTRQQEDCQQLAATVGWDVTEVYVDNDTSAYKDRPAYNRMLNDIRAGNLDAIIAWAPDRIYRRMADLETLIEVIEKHKTEIRTVKAGDLDLSGAYGRMIARILGSIAAGEGEIKSERWRRSWLQRREAGDFAKNGRRTFGYTVDGQVIDDERTLAQWMATQILKGVPYLTVCRQLDALEIRTTLGNPWTPQGLKRFLTNPRIAGWSATNGRIISEGKWEPLIDRETYEGVKAILGSNTRPYVPRVSLLTGLLYCACGQRMVTSSQKRVRTYRCPRRPGMDGCGKVSANAEPIEVMVEAYTQERLANPAVREAIGRLRADGDGGPYAELAAIELRLIELEKSLDDPGLSLDAILRAIERARDKQAELQAQIVARSNVPIPASDADWPTDLSSRRNLVDLVVQRITLNPATKASRLGFDVERVQVQGR